MTELQTRIQESDLASLPDWEVADILNTPDPALPPTYGSILNADVMRMLISFNVWASIVDKSKNSQNASEKALCLNIVDSVSTRDYMFDLSNSEIRTPFETMLSSAISAGLFTQEQGEFISSKAYRLQSWAEYNNIEVTARTVGIARGGQA
ncbi:MAG: hypothetical protein ACK5U7_08215 [Bacteroidota bacterium]|jgi:squalene cyclase